MNHPLPDIYTPRYRKLGNSSMELSQTTLKARREFAMGICRKHGLSGQDFKTVWRDLFLAYVERYLDDITERNHYLSLFKQISTDNGGRLPFYFYVLLDYSLFSSFQRFIPNAYVLLDNNYFDSTRPPAAMSFFCHAGEFSYIRQKYSSGNYSNFFSGNTLSEYLQHQAAMVDRYYGLELYKIEPSSPDSIDIVSSHPPEVSRNDCLSNIHIFFRGWLDLRSPREKLSNAWKAVETSCIILGDSECRFRFSKNSDRS